MRRKLLVQFSKLLGISKDENVQRFASSACIKRETLEETERETEKDRERQGETDIQTETERNK